MGGIFGTISKKSCVADLFYGTDYNSHLGTRRGGLATYSSEKGFVRSIHNLESSYFRTKFEPTLNKFEGATSGIGVISDTDAQPLIMNSHLGRFAICTVAKIVNKDELTQLLLEKNMHFAEMSSGSTNPTELVALLIIQGKTFREGIENVFHHIKGSCTMMILTEDGIICARDSWGRTPIIIGKKEGAYAASSETTSFPNLDYETAYEVGPGEIVKITADGSAAADASSAAGMQFKQRHAVRNSRNNLFIINKAYHDGKKMSNELFAFIELFFVSCLV